VAQLLRKVGAELRRKPEARVLQGAALHDQFLQTGDKGLAQRADGHYMVALELVRRNPRYKATVLEQLGFLHAQVGNWRIALGYLEDREKLPFDDDAASLAHDLIKAQTLLHTGREEDAVKAIEEALASTKKNAALEPYHVLALDRAALYNLSAGKFARALELYEEELPLAPGERNQVVLRLAHAAAALGAGEARRALDGLAIVDGRLADAALEKRGALAWPHFAPDEVWRSYRVMAAGLRARAHRAIGELDRAARALETRRNLLKERYDRQKVDEQLKGLVLVESQLADVAIERKDTAAAITWARAALEHADAFVSKTKVALDSRQLGLLWLAAELRLDSGSRVRFNLPKRLRKAHETLAAQHDPSWRSYQSLFEIYVALFSSTKGRRSELDSDEEELTLRSRRLTLLRDIIER
jgi:tetratricopeptide (TPR) repeat protein